MGFMDNLSKFTNRMANAMDNFSEKTLDQYDRKMDELERKHDRGQISDDEYFKEHKRLTDLALSCASYLSKRENNK